jgi:hypothetical protein
VGYANEKQHVEKEENFMYNVGGEPERSRTLERARRKWEKY